MEIEHVDRTPSNWTSLKQGETAIIIAGDNPDYVGCIIMMTASGGAMCLGPKYAGHDVHGKYTVDKRPYFIKERLLEDK